MSNDPQDQSADLLTLLANQRRRSIVLTLSAVGACDIDTLARFVVALEKGQIDRATDTATVRQVRNNIRNRHSEKLAAAGILERSARDVSPGPKFATAVRTLAMSWQLG